MKIKKQNPEPEAKTLTEVFDEISAFHTRNAETISHQRQHAIESQLRACIRLMGFRPRETAAKPASITELIAQAIQALNILEGEVPEQKHELIAMYALAVHSNLNAEECYKLIENPPVPEVPPEK